MKDIDFDELDRAVNSLISPGAKASQQPAETAPVASVDLPAVKPVESIASTPPLAERRSSGRFMDVVHPSSDMRSVTVPPRSNPPVIEPTTNDQKPEATSPQSQQEHSWPDPIDVQGAENPQEAPVNVEPLPPTENASVEPVSPLETPFLSNAKVEKRPLGAFSNEVHEAGPADAAVVPKTDVPSEDITPLDTKEKSSDHPIENDTPLPAELQPGLLSIESNEGSASTENATVVSQAPAGPTSITQQYVEKPSTGDKPTGNVFNTEAYKKPQTSKKKKSGWLVVLWIFLLLAVGAGIGAAVYFFVLPRL